MLLPPLDSIMLRICHWTSWERLANNNNNNNNHNDNDNDNNNNNNITTNARALTLFVLRLRNSNEFPGYFEKNGPLQVKLTHAVFFVLCSPPPLSWVNWQPLGVYLTVLGCMVCWIYGRLPSTLDRIPTDLSPARN